MVISPLITGILLELIVLVGGIYLIFKYFKKISNTPNKIKIKIIERTTSETIHGGVKSAIREITYEDEQEKLFEKKRKVPEQIYSSISQKKEHIDSGGELIPFDLTEKERESLKLFYSKSD